MSTLKLTGSLNSNADTGSTSAMILPGGSGLGLQPKKGAQAGWARNCVRCDEFARKVAEAVIKECRESLVAAYEDAGISGLCAEGRWEMALDSLRSINLSKIIT